MRHGRSVNLILSESDYAFLQKMADSAGVKKSEFLRLIVQGLKVGDAIMNNRGAKVEIGGYGFEFSQEYLESFIKQLEPILDHFGNGIKVTTPKTKQRAAKRQIKPLKLTA